MHPAERFLAALDDEQRARACYAMSDDARLQWDYRPRPRPGICIADVDRTARKAAHQLVATVLSRHAFAQVCTIMALEEVLDLDEGGHRGRHSADYWVAIFGEPGDDVWSWRFEGHHVSVTATVVDGKTIVAPLFLGANPATVTYRDATIVRPLPLEEELARALLDELTTEQRELAVVAPEAPRDIHTTMAPRVDSLIEPGGVPARVLRPPARDLLQRLVDTYLDRLARPAVPALDEATFAWEGPLTRGAGHYYRVQTPGLLIEYDNTQHGANHAHTVLRQPGDDFGAGLLARHHSSHHAK